MATLSTNFFNLELSHVPAINNRFDFNNLLALFRNETFRRQFLGHKGKRIPIRTHYFTWHGRAEVLLTHLLREAVVGIESAVSSAVFIEGIHRGKAKQDFIEATKYPFSLNGKRGTADKVFNKLPAIIDPDFALKKSDPALWERVRSFYKEVRNKIFHAYEVGSKNADPVWQCLELLLEIYHWLNNWHSISILSKWPIQWSPEALKLMEEVPVISDLHILQLAPARDLPAKGRAKKGDLPSGCSTLAIKEISGLYLPSAEMVDISLVADDDSPVKVHMSPHAAMKLLLFLSLAQENRSWAVPDRL